MSGTSGDRSLKEGDRSSSLLVRKAEPEDAHVIQSIAQVTWPIAYRTIISKAQIAYMLERMYAPSQLVSEIHGRHIYLIAERNGEAIGFAAVEHGYTGTTNTRLHKLYVLPAKQGCGAGSLLMEHVKTAAQEKGDLGIELNVNRHNRAVETYRNWGFSIAYDVVLDIGNGFVMDDHVMVLSLVNKKHGSP